MAEVVSAKLQMQWSPEQIAGWLKRTYSGDEGRYVSHETIYRSLFIQARGALKKELLQQLRRTRGMRRSRHHTQKTADHGRITDPISISERPLLLKIGLCLVIGRATCYSAVAIARSPPLSNARHAT